jgi:hypothetical protein
MLNINGERVRCSVGGVLDVFVQGIDENSHFILLPRRGLISGSSSESSSGAWLLPYRFFFFLFGLIEWLQHGRLYKTRIWMASLQGPTAGFEQ